MNHTPTNPKLANPKLANPKLANPIIVKPRQLTGRHVLMYLLLFFGVVISVNVYFLTAAITSFRGEDVKGSYRQGIDYNNTIQKRAAQKQLGWQASYNIMHDDEQNSRLLIAVKNDKGDTLRDLVITARLRHPTDTALDIPITFSLRDNGTYRSLESVPKGQWKLNASASNGGEDFKFEFDL